jgi:tetratricopeptide (TPR) repeat protein
MSTRALQQLSGRSTPIGDGRLSAQRSAAASPGLHHRSAAASPHHRSAAAASPHMQNLNYHSIGGEEPGEGAMDKLLECERTFATLKREGRHLDALPHMEMSVFLRKQIYGANSREVLKACQVFTTSCNTLAMNCLQKDDYMKAYELLKKAELLTEPRGYLTDDKARLKLRAVTFNNLGCFYKRRGKLHAALQYLDKALKIELASDEVDNPAGTHLNLCATLSQLGRHQPALEHAQCALDLLKQSLSRKGALNGGASGKAGEEASILAIAYHNMAVEQEHLGQWEGALQSYGESVAMAERQWGPQHPKTHAIFHSYQQAKEKLARKGGRLPALRGGGIRGGNNAATIAVGGRDNGRGAVDAAEIGVGNYGKGARHTTLPALGGKRNPRDNGGAVSVPPLGTHGAYGGGSAPVTPPGGKRPAALRIPQQSYNSAPVSSRGWGPQGAGSGGMISPINGPGSMTGPPGAGMGECFPPWN